MTSFEESKELYRKKFGRLPEWIVRCPGRVNLIGEHVDYSDYSVLPMATEESTFIAMGTNAEPMIILESIEPGKYPSFLYAFPSTADGEDLFAGVAGNRWHNYFLAGWRGILEWLTKNGKDGESKPRGMFALVGSRIPPSAGLSSSSALVCAAAMATLAHQTGVEFRIPKEQLADIATHAERYVGTEGGGMDQACECLAEHGTALRIDFRPLKWTTVRLPDSALFAVLHSGTEHRLSDDSQHATSHYNERVVECRIAAQVLAMRSGKLKSPNDWREVRTLKQAATLFNVDQPTAMCAWVKKFLCKDDKMSPHSRAEICEILCCSDADLAKHCLNATTQTMQEFWLAKRAEHVFTESSRVYEFQRVCNQTEISEEKKLHELAELMNASHRSCRDFFECSCDALDATVEKCLAKGCLAARLTGAGWGGCVVALIEKSKKESIVAAGLDVLFWSEPSAGIEAIKINGSNG